MLQSRVTAKREFSAKAGLANPSGSVRATPKARMDVVVFFISVFSRNFVMVEK
jgi:hypothetical protein